VSVTAVVLAAGASSRYGTTPPKQQVFLPRVLDALAASQVDDVLVVLGAHDVETTAPSIRCDEWERGPGASLRCGLAALPPEVGAALVVLADGPELDPRAIDRILDAWEGGGAVAASYDGVRLHPVLIPRAAWAHIPDDGARTLAVRLVPCDDLRPPGDVDE
jgi:CTP:molybdopterin cytidylyltransferase MocA